MIFGELLGHLRTAVLRDTAVPQLWSDFELTKYLNDGYVDFCRRTHLLTDAESAFTTFDTEAGTPDYALDQRIVRINELGVYIEDDSVDPPVSTYRSLRDGTRSQVPHRELQGVPSCYTQQIGVVPSGTTTRSKVRLYPVPDDVYTVQMLVVRKPLARLSDINDRLEIDDDYELALCDYAAWRALTNNRTEGANMAQAEKFKEAYLFAVKDAKRNIALQRAGVFPRAVANWTGKVTRR